MPVTSILLLRHGHRLAWSLDPTTGKYTSSHPFPTKLPADPPLASHGVRQAEETGTYLSELLLGAAMSSTLRIYSSLFYRCLETLRPTVEKLRESIRTGADSHQVERLLRNLEVRGERGLGEWFGHAWFKQPTPAKPTRLKEDFFPWLNADYNSKVVPDVYGERIGTLHDRIARALHQVVVDVDEEFEAQGQGKEDVTLVICGHAAQIICAGRALTGSMPEDHDDEDFKCYTCGISKFSRRIKQATSGRTEGDWRNNGGVAGGWDCILNSDCRHLSQGEERGWHFHGDESFDSYGPGTGQIITSDGGLGPWSSRSTTDSIENVSKL